MLFLSSATRLHNLMGWAKKYIDCWFYHAAACKMIIVNETNHPQTAEVGFLKTESRKLKTESPNRAASVVRPSVCKYLQKSLLLPDKWLDRHQTCTRWSPEGPASRLCSRSRSRWKVTWNGHFCDGTKCLLYSTLSRSVSTCAYFMKHHYTLLPVQVSGS